MRIYMSGVFDLFHHGHIRIIEKAKNYKNLNNTIVIGIHNDEDVAKYKRKPIQTMSEREEIVKACRYVDEVILNAPNVTTKEFLKSINCDMIAGITCNCGNIMHDSQYDDVKDIFIDFGYTPGVSTTDLIERCYQYRLKSL